MLFRSQLISDFDLLTTWMHYTEEDAKSIIGRMKIQKLEDARLQVLQQNPQFDIYVRVGIPNELKRKAPITIEVTAGIETTKTSPEWIDILNRECDKIITISQHSKDVLEQTSWKAQDQFGRTLDLKLEKPVEVVGFPIKQFKHFDNLREWLPLDYDFNFLCVAQWGPRKNIENTIRWFVEEFKKDKVGLVCKLNGANNSTIDRNMINDKISSILDNYKDRVCKVYLLHGDMEEEELHGLYINPKIKAIVNFGHGEGFGLPLFEAAYSGLPVIAVEIGRAHV